MKRIVPSAASPATVKSGKSAAFPPDHVRVQSTVPAVSSAPSARGAAACSRRVPSAIASAVAAYKCTHKGARTYPLSMEIAESLIG